MRNLTKEVKLLRSVDEFFSHCRTRSVINGASMLSLVLEPATDHGNHYEVLDEARNVVGHIMLSDAAPPEMPWIWSISSGHRAGRKPTYGYEATCEAAMEACARVWHRK